MEVLEMRNDLWIGGGTPHLPKVELDQHANHGQSKSRPVGLGFLHHAGGHQVWMDSDPGM